MNAPMRPEDVPHEYVMAAMKASGLLHHDTARPALAAVLPMYRAEVLREAADAIEAFADSAEQDAIANDGQAYGRNNRTVAAYREIADLVHRLAKTAKEQS